MDVSVNLQDPFSYARWPMITFSICVALCVIFLIVVFIKRNLRGRVKTESVKKVVVNKKAVKADIFGKLDALERRYDLGEISVREVYQELSVLMRAFVDMMLGTKASNRTLTEIKEMGLPILESLIEEYYSPEFARKSEGDVKASFANAKRVVSEWN